MPTTDTAPLSTTIRNGAIIGMAAAVGMAMYAMVASATYQHHGFFTPLFHISALTGSPKSMMQSLHAAMSGETFWFTPGAALCGLLIHMITGAMYGIGFALLVRRVRAAGAVVAAGMAYGAGAMVFSGIIGLPVAAAIMSAGNTISDMPQMVGWATFAIEHLLFGMILGIGVAAVRAAAAPASAGENVSAALA